MKFHVIRSLLVAFTVLFAAGAPSAQQTGAESAAETAKRFAEAADIAAQTEARRNEEAKAPPILDAADVTVRYIKRTDDDAKELASALARVAGRSFFLRGKDGSISGPFGNIDRLGSSVVLLHDRTDVMADLQSTLEQIALASAPSVEEERESSAPLQVVEFRPLHQTVEHLLGALEPLRRRVINHSPSASGEGVQVNNVSALEETGLLVLRDTEENLAVMTALLSRLDVPAPQVMVTCLLIAEGMEAFAPPGANEIPADLLHDLQQLLPVHDLRRIGMAAMRVAVVPERSVILSGTAVDGSDFQLSLVPGGYDRAQGLLSLAKCEFSVDGDGLFKTSAVLRANEYVVLGASGTQPLFVVLRLTPLDG